MPVKRMCCTIFFAAMAVSCASRNAEKTWQYRSDAGTTLTISQKGPQTFISVGHIVRNVATCLPATDAICLIDEYLSFSVPMKVPVRDELLDMNGRIFAIRKISTDLYQISTSQAGQDSRYVFSYAQGLLSICYERNGECRRGGDYYYELVSNIGFPF